MSTSPATVGVVVIGRNEGERLRVCLHSVLQPQICVIYVDSGSSDGSADMARSMGTHVVDLDLSTPFTAARARNAGLARLLELRPDTEFIQFVDGDCEIAPKWVHSAAQALQSHPELAAVCGRLRERFPDASIYNRLCDIEWNGPVGEVAACGGIAMYRISSFQAVGGFDPGIPAGEEPELCHRLSKAGWKIVRLPDDMGWHDADIRRFSQWWRRQTRGGYGSLNLLKRFGLPRYARQVRSVRRWTCGWGLVVLLAIVAGWAIGGFLLAAALGVAAIGLVPLQAARIARRIHRLGYPLGTSFLAGCFGLLSHWAQLWGHLRCTLDHRSGKAAPLIEYKSTARNSHAPIAG